MAALGPDPPAEAKRYLFPATSALHAVERRARQVEDVLLRENDQHWPPQVVEAGLPMREHVAVSHTGTVPRLLFDSGSAAHVYERQARELEEYLDELQRIECSSTEHVSVMTQARSRLHHQAVNHGDYQELSNFSGFGWSLRPYNQLWIASRPLPQIPWGSAMQLQYSPVRTPAGLIGSGAPEYGRGSIAAIL
eukprot:CAMPEP_0178372138 /NCGR_PEP_ID=MMETSP0689_2-20121128/1196_1 /TAXON_ID=160604 /ORGANISM="Amphidinium massartii, Strain CS-259" /LENGTH=192 /DNA_ID=CAMNT_0019992047 /DNA_START=85 /DNA_END=660 /DNA_ORIENTATION=+